MPELPFELKVSWRNREVCRARNCGRSNADGGRGLCNKHYLQAWFRGTLPPGPQAECVVCGRPFEKLGCGKTCGEACRSVRKNQRAGERHGSPGAWLVTACAREADLAEERLKEAGYRAVPRRTGSRQAVGPHYSRWTVEHVHVIRYCDPRRVRERKAA